MDSTLQVLLTFIMQFVNTPGGFWPDQKTGDHTLLIYWTNQSISNALSKLAGLVWKNPYI